MYRVCLVLYVFYAFFFSEYVRSKNQEYALEYEAFQILL